MEYDSLFRARQLTDEYATLLRSVAGRRVRVIRAVVYEGDGETVIRQLAGSLPVGTKEAHRGKVTITVAQGEIEVLNPPVTQPPRIEVCRIDPDTLVGIAPCDDGEPGWATAGAKPSPPPGPRSRSCRRWSVGGTRATWTSSSWTGTGLR